MNDTHEFGFYASNGADTYGKHVGFDYDQAVRAGYEYMRQCNKMVWTLTKYDCGWTQEKYVSYTAMFYAQDEQLFVA